MVTILFAVTLWHSFYRADAVMFFSSLLCDVDKMCGQVEHFPHEADTKVSEKNTCEEKPGLLILSRFHKSMLQSVAVWSPVIATQASCYKNYIYATKAEFVGKLQKR